MVSISSNINLKELRNTNTLTIESFKNIIFNTPKILINGLEFDKHIKNEVLLETNTRSGTWNTDFLTNTARGNYDITTMGSYRNTNDEVRTSFVTAKNTYETFSGNKENYINIYANNLNLNGTNLFFNNLLFEKYIDDTVNNGSSSYSDQPTSTTDTLEFEIKDYGSFTTSNMDITKITNEGLRNNNNTTDLVFESINAININFGADFKLNTGLVTNTEFNDYLKTFLDESSSLSIDITPSSGAQITFTFDTFTNSVNGTLFNYEVTFEIYLNSETNIIPGNVKDDVVTNNVNQSSVPTGPHTFDDNLVAGQFYKIYATVRNLHTNTYVYNIPLDTNIATIDFISSFIVTNNKETGWNISFIGHPTDVPAMNGDLVTFKLRIKWDTGVDDVVDTEISVYFNLGITQDLDTENSKNFQGGNSVNVNVSSINNGTYNYGNSYIHYKKHEFQIESSNTSFTMLNIPSYELDETFLGFSTPTNVANANISITYDLSNNRVRFTVDPLDNPGTQYGGTSTIFYDYELFIGGSGQGVNTFSRNEGDYTSDEIINYVNSPLSATSYEIRILTRNYYFSNGQYTESITLTAASGSAGISFQEVSASELRINYTVSGITVNSDTTLNGNTNNVQIYHNVGNNSYGSPNYRNFSSGDSYISISNPNNGTHYAKNFVDGYFNDFDTGDITINLNQPSGMSMTVLIDDDGRISIEYSITMNCNNGSVIIEYKRNAGAYGTHVSLTKSGTISNETQDYTENYLDGNTTYTFRIKANGYGDDIYSSEYSTPNTNTWFGAPGTPSGLSLAKQGSTQIRCNWSAPTKSVNGKTVNQTLNYEVKLYRDGGHILTTNTTAIQHDFTESVGGNYYFTVRAYTNESYGTGGTATSSTVSITFIVQPTAPTLNSVNPNASSDTIMDLYWTGNSHGTATGISYTITNVTTTGTKANSSTSTGSINDTFTGLTPGTSYTFKITKNTDGSHNNPESGQLSNTTTLVNATKPSNITETNSTINSLSISWTLNSNGRASVSSLTIHYSTSASVPVGSSSEITGVSSGATSYTIGSLNPGTTYYFRVEKIVSSPYSNQASDVSGSMSTGTAASLTNYGPNYVTNKLVEMDWTIVDYGTPAFTGYNASSTITSAYVGSFPNSPTRYSSTEGDGFFTSSYNGITLTTSTTGPGTNTSVNFTFNITDYFQTPGVPTGVSIVNNSGTLNCSWNTVTDMGEKTVAGVTVSTINFTYIYELYYDDTTNNYATTDLLLVSGETTSTSFAYALNGATGPFKLQVKSSNKIYESSFSSFGTLTVNTNYKYYGFGVNSIGQSGELAKDDGYNYINNGNTYNQLTSAFYTERTIEKITTSWGVSFYHINGYLYTSGRNHSGQLGLGYINTNGVLYPKRVTFFDDKNIVDATGGKEFSLFLTSDGNLYGVGLNDEGQLGIGDTTDRLTISYITNNVSSISAGWSHYIIIKTDNTVYSSGNNDYGKLGFTGGGVSTLTSVTISFTPVEVKCGQHSSYLKSSTGDYYSCGWNIDGQLGYGTGTSNTGVNAPFALATEINNLSVASIHPAIKGCYIVTTSNRIYSLGYGLANASPEYDYPHPERLDPHRFEVPEESFTQDVSNVFVFNLDNDTMIFEVNASHLWLAGSMFYLDGTTQHYAAYRFERYANTPTTETPVYFVSTNDWKFFVFQ